IVGNITDTKMLDMLKDAEGFCRLVHSIGVSVETDEPEQKVDFVFQMYGKEAAGESTMIKRSLSGNGVEERILLDEVTWYSNDREPGQIRFEFEKPEILGRANVRFFLRDGYSAPQPEEEGQMDFESEDYRKMIARSLLFSGNTARVRKAVEKAQRGENVTIAYIGGSITQGAGATPIHHECYAYKSFQAFARLFGKDKNVHFIKAGVGGTPSELGIIRFERDILRDCSVEPDIVVIEFAVNDEGDETKGICYESLVRKVLSLPGQPAVVLLFAVFASDWNLQDRLKPVGYHYELPMVSIMDAVTPQFKLKPDTGRVLSKNQFFYDIFHPNNAGHTIMADCLTYFFEQAAKGEGGERQDETERLLQKTPVIGSDFEKVRLLDRKENCEGKEIDCGSFCWKDETMQCVEMDEDLTGTAEFPYNWMYQGSREKSQPYFELKICCRALLLVFKDSGDSAFGKADLFVDGKKIRTADPLINGWVHVNPVILIREKESSMHVVRISMAEGEEEKNFTILGFGYVE
ncbi:MAG: SGNH/GDSL hydrolase family protein, partial [Lachnospiraceae bacterium]|nr:SGNH/GDSL hydrolase family protein [Lachnospiraceae bacterium]